MDRRPLDVTANLRERSRARSRAMPNRVIDVRRGDVRFSVGDVVIRNDEGQRCQVTYSDASGAHEIVGEAIVGCDGDGGVSRASIPKVS